MNTNHKDKTKVSYLILDFNRPEEGELLLTSLQSLARHPKEVVYLCNGGNSSYAIDFYNRGLIDTLIIKKDGDGGGFGQTDLWRYCKTKYAFFLQVDHILVSEIKQETINYFIDLLENKSFKCIDLNGDQSNKGGWTDRAHFMSSEFFNSLAPFPNGGPGTENEGFFWNEEYLGNTFANNGFKIAHISPLFFRDCGKWSVRQAGDGLYKYRCDTKNLYVLGKPTYRTEVFPPFNDSEWELAINGNWPKDGMVPKQWEKNSFIYWAERDRAPVNEIAAKHLVQ